MTVEVDLVKLAVGLLVSGLVGAISFWGLGVVILLVSALLDHWQGKRIRRLERELDVPKKPVAWRHYVDTPRRAGRAEMLHRFQEQADKDIRAGCDREAR